MVSRSVRSCGGEVRYSTMLHSILPYRCVLQVLRGSRRDEAARGTRYPANPGILWNLHKQVPYGIQVCQDGWDQVRSGTELLACATWRSAEWGRMQVLLRSGCGEVQDLPYPGILWTLLK